MEILYPMFGMIFVTAIVMMLLYISRIQALSNRSKNPNKLPNEVARHSDEIRKYMTPRNRFITENYNHLFEQPIVFYAISFCIWGLNLTNNFFIFCAWSYFVIRVIHSIFQSTLNLVWIRFGLFILSWLVLAAMIIKLSIDVFF